MFKENFLRIHIQDISLFHIKYHIFLNEQIITDKSIDVSTTDKKNY